MPDEPEHPARPLAWRGPAIFALALLVRAIHLSQSSDASFFDMLMGDAEAYVTWAREIAGGDWVGDRVFYQAPLYPYFVAAVFELLGDDPTAVKWVQSLLGSLACVMLAVAGSRFFSRRVGLVAGIGLALYPPAIFFDGLLQKSALDLFLSCALLAVLGRLRLRATPLWWAVAGCVLGALVLTRENALVLVPPVFAFALLSTVSRRAAFGRVALVTVGAALLLVPVAARNHAVGGEFHLTTSQFGTNFYIGNGEAANGRYVPLRFGRGTWRHESADATALAEAALGRPLTPGEVSSYWTSRTLDAIRARPVDWLGLLAHKAFLVVNATELVDTEDIHTHARASLLLGALLPVWHFGVVLPIAVLGVIVTRSRWRELWILHGLAACYALSVVGFYVFARYRYPLVPFAMLFAAAGLVGLREFWRSSAARDRVIAAAVVLLAAIVCNWPVERPEAMQAATLRNVGVVLLQRGDPAGAEVELRRAFELDSGNVLVVHSLATARLEQGDLDEAEALYRRALARKPDLAASHARLGVILARRGDHVEALEHQRRAIAIEPDLALAHFQAGLSLAMLRRYDQADAAFREAMRLDEAAAPRLAKTVLGTLERVADGSRQARVALRLARLAFESAPEAPYVAAALGAAQAANGDVERGGARLAEAARRAKDDPQVTEDEREQIEAFRARYGTGATR